MRLKIAFENSAEPFGGAPPTIQYTNNLQQLLADSEAVRPLLSDITATLIGEANHDLVGIHTGKGPRAIPAINLMQNSLFEAGPPKTEARIKEKVSAKFQGYYENLLDLARGRIQINDPDQLAALCAVIEWAYEHNVELPHGAQIISCDNKFRFPTDTGYSDFDAKIAIPVPNSNRYHIAELMIRHRDFERQISADKRNKFGKSSHDAYVLARHLEARINGGRADREITKVHRDMVKACTDIHNRARQAFELDAIDFGRFKNFRDQQTEQMLEQEISRIQGSRTAEPVQESASLG